MSNLKGKEINNGMNGALCAPSSGTIIEPKERGQGNETGLSRNISELVSMKGEKSLVLACVTDSVIRKKKKSKHTVSFLSFSSNKHWGTLVVSASDINFYFFSIGISMK